MCLEKRKELVKEYFEEMHANGCISEATFNMKGLPKDTDSTGKGVHQFNDPKIENYHCAKIFCPNANLSTLSPIGQEKDD